MGDKDTVRIKFLERPMRWYYRLTFHRQAFIKTVIISFILVYPSYSFAYMIKSFHSKAEIMAKQDPHCTSDELKMKIKEYKKRKEMGIVESMAPYKEKKE